MPLWLVTAHLVNCQRPCTKANNDKGCSEPGQQTDFCCKSCIVNPSEGTCVAFRRNQCLFWGGWGPGLGVLPAGFWGVSSAMVVGSGSRGVGSGTIGAKKCYVVQSPNRALKIHSLKREKYLCKQRPEVTLPSFLPREFRKIQNTGIWGFCLSKRKPNGVGT